MAITDNLTEKIKQARAAGYSEDQIKTYLTSKGVAAPRASLLNKATAAAEKVTKTLGLDQPVDFISSALTDITHPVLQQKAGIKPVGITDALEAGARLGVTLPAPELGGVAVIAAKKVATQAATKVGQKVGAAADDLATKAADIVTSIDKGVETVLTQPGPQNASRVAEKFSRYITQSEKALADYSQPTAMELAGQEGERALNALQLAKTTIGQRKSAVTSTLGHIPVPELAPVARQTLRDLVRERTGIVFKADQTLRKAAGRLSNVSDAADIKLIKQVDTKLAELEKSPTFRRADDAVDYIQDLLFKRTGATAVPVNGKIEAALKNVVSSLNDGLQAVAKKAGNTDYEALNTAYGDYKEVFDVLNKGLGMEGNKGAALMKQLFSPSGTLPRKLFADIKAKTGIDLVEEATLAKFAMESIGDVRQASLLEQVLKGSVAPNTGSLIQLAAEKILGKIKDPIGKAKRLIGQPSK